MFEISRLSGKSACFRVAVSALIFDGERVLLSHRSDIDWWNLPGGGVEAGETVDEAICREVGEETGLEVEVESLVGVYSKPQKQEIVLTFRCHVTGGTLRTTKETCESKYFLPNKLPYNTLPKHRQRIEDALLNQQTTVIRAQRRSTAEDQGLNEVGAGRRRKLRFSDSYHLFCKRARMSQRSQSIASGRK